MRYFYTPPEAWFQHYGELYICDHPVYTRCTLFKIGVKGLAVIQQRFDPNKKRTFWTEIDPWLNDELYLNLNFKSFFDERAGEAQNGLYPTVTIRQIMSALKMKPLKKERWETVFDRRII